MKRMNGYKGLLAGLALALPITGCAAQPYRTVSDGEGVEHADVGYLMDSVMSAARKRDGRVTWKEIRAEADKDKDGDVTSDEALEIYRKYMDKQEAK